MKSISIQSLLLRCFSVLLVGFIAGCGGGGDEVRLSFTASLSGDEEVPPSGSQARGIGIIIFDPSDRSFRASVVTSGMSDADAHIHEGPPGTSGPIVIPLTRDPGSVVWTARGTLTAEQEQALRAGNYYFNVHSPTFPEGEIRGQIERDFPSDAQLQQLQQARQGSNELADQLRAIAAMR